MFKIGDKVWFAQIKSGEDKVLCPECFGKKYLTVILGDDTRVSIECVGCKRGYNEPTGYVYYFKRFVDVFLVTIERMEIEKDKVEYGFNGCYQTKESRLFIDKESAEKEAARLIEELNKEELAKIYTKEKHNHNWAWNVYYHRNCIKKAQHELEYHTAKLNYAKTKVKEEKE